MPEETQYLGRTEVEGEGYLEPSSYKVHCRCLRCGRKYTREIKRISDPDPPCPYKACKEAIAREHAAKEEHHVEQMIETGETPGHVGNNPRVNAVDATAQIVMEDYHMTDLKDNTRTGDAMVPALSPRQREMDKNFWGGGRVRERRKPTFLRGIGGRDEDTMGQKALSGAFIPDMTKGMAPQTTGGDVLADLHARKAKPRTEIIYDANKIKG